ncbi:MAG: exsH [Frankiales bacterium]|nr:exsH [Frankiales bacterium]
MLRLGHRTVRCTVPAVLVAATTAVLDCRQRSAAPPRPVVAQAGVTPSPLPLPPPRVDRDAMPRGHRPGWRQVLAQDFTGTALPRGWGAYAGRPGGNPHGWWEPSHVRVRAGDLHLAGAWKGGRFVTGGLMATGTETRYGKYEVRFRIERARGVKYALLLWPSRGRWPAAGEVDFAEDGGGGRRTTTATLHHGAANHQVQRTLRADFSAFQTVGVEWTPGKLVYTCNGRPWATVRSAGVPRGPMRLALQMEAGRGDAWAPAPSAATPPTVGMVVDWVVGYRRA